MLASFYMPYTSSEKSAEGVEGFRGLRVFWVEGFSGLGVLGVRVVKLSPIPLEPPELIVAVSGPRYSCTSPRLLHGTVTQAVVHKHGAAVLKP